MDGIKSADSLEGVSPDRQTSRCNRKRLLRQIGAVEISLVVISHADFEMAAPAVKTGNNTGVLHATIAVEE
ncbi:hypothetical protein ABTN55_19655, partial [Acinetobacter baumannii]